MFDVAVVGAGVSADEDGCCEEVFVFVGAFEQGPGVSCALGIAQVGDDEFEWVGVDCIRVFVVERIEDGAVPVCEFLFAFLSWPECLEVF